MRFRDIAFWIIVFCLAVITGIIVSAWIASLNLGQIHGRYKIVIDDGVAYTPLHIECATEYAFVEGGGITWVDCYTNEAVVYFKAANETLSVGSFE